MILLLADHAGLLLYSYFFEGFPRDDMSAGPEGHELIEAIVLQFSDWASDVVIAFYSSSFDDDLGDD